MPRSVSIGEENYTGFAARYAAMVGTKPENAQLVEPAMKALLPDLKDMRVLDAGCGSGHYTQYFVDHGASVVAFDVTPDFVSIAGERLKNFSDCAEIIRHDLDDLLDFAEDGSFDIVFCNLVLDYIEDWHQTFREFRRVLKRGGVFLFSCGDPAGDWQYIQRDNVILEGDPTYRHVQQFTAEWTSFGKPYQKIVSYRRPYSAILQPLIEAGFRINRITEPAPTAQFQAMDAMRYERALHWPMFLCIRALC